MVLLIYEIGSFSYQKVCLSKKICPLYTVSYIWIIIQSRMKLTLEHVFIPYIKLIKPIWTCFQNNNK